MSDKQALEVLTQIAEAYKGNAEEHRLLAKALAIVNDLIKDKDKPEA